MVAIKNILFFITAASALSIGRRDTSTVLSDISTIDSDVKSLTSAVNNYNGGLLAAIPIENSESALEQAITKGTNDAQATSQLSTEDTQTVIAAVDNLSPDIQAALVALVNKKSQFTSAGLKSTVQKDLANLKADTDDFADALIAIASDDSKSAANDRKATIDGYFATAINAYNS
ncbi:hypothetical protein GLAREA_09023 [Glarea lozoyensis ATCC 20868]|uniref:Hydrophobic surface binding protein A n=1 Tax=Glarea lozoyensis (strain ATCC 20868 / MF5171) TaxID=1116229 RepID=S3DGQ3_GLAL2|nr:uncharacterized protein GLAREA_09023 [Glarea lozoyensis ATCC 20868]EPE36860.1 hypothetical protein GLAREA_09023 [Glarea lozoyensis ATCC 20868]